MRRFLRRRRLGGRVRVPLLLAVGAALLAAPSAGAGGQAGYGCPPAFDLGSQTIDPQILALPRIHEGISAGTYTAADVVALLETIDHNGDGVLCVQTVPAGNSSVIPAPWLYHYNIVDNNASVPTG